MTSHVGGAACTATLTTATLTTAMFPCALQLCDMGYSATDIITTLFRVTKNAEVHVSGLGVWSLGCGLWGCGAWDVALGVWSLKYKGWGVEFEMGLECGAGLLLDTSTKECCAAAHVHRPAVWDHEQSGSASEQSVGVGDLVSLSAARLVMPLAI